TGDLFGNDDAQTFSNYDDNTKVLFVPNETELNGITIEHARIAVDELRWMTDCTVRYCSASGDDLPRDREERSPIFAREARIVGSTFHNNRGEQYGGALTARGLTAIANCRFLQNQAPVGGSIGVELYESVTFVIQNTYFAANRADSETGGVGGAVFNGYLSGESSTQIAHCVFAGNEAIDGMIGGPTSATGRIVLYNSILDQNYSAIGTGIEAETGALFLGNQTSSPTTLRRNVFRTYNEELETSTAYPNIRLNTEANPGFHNLLGPDGTLGTLDDDPSLGDLSASIDWSTTIDDLPDGHVEQVLYDLADLDGDCMTNEPLSIDLLGNPRTIGDAPDAGCIEYIPGGPARPITDWTYIDPQVTDFSTEPIRLYVNAKSEGGDGSSWESALSNPNEALAIASGRLGPVEIWVAAGEYLPQITRSGIDSFRLSENVTMLGGFAGNETEADHRDPAQHKTVLAGDYLGDDDPLKVGSFYDNARQIVVSIGPRGGGVLDGFSITGGSPKRRLVGGLWLYYDQLSIPDAAGLLYAGSGDTRIQNCEFGPWVLNTLTADTVGNNPFIALQGSDSNLWLVSSQIFSDFTEGVSPRPFLLSNRAVEGVIPRVGAGALSIVGSNIELRQSPSGSPFLAGQSVLCINAGQILFHRSTLTSNRGLLLHAPSSRGTSWIDSALVAPEIIVIQSILTHAELIGVTCQSGMFNLQVGQTPFSKAGVRISNSVFAVESAIIGIASDRASVSGTVFPSSFDLGSHPNADASNTFDFKNNAAAFFLDPLGPDGEPHTGDEDLRLAPGSPAINSGLNEFVTSDSDLDGNERIIGSVVDRGAYEFTGTCTGDVNGDGEVNLGDLNLVLANFGQELPFGDASGDGAVDLADLNLVLAAFGHSCSD
ncbi:MAG: choice-of-anchor Q domain-containing protein, partial [Phycisphaerales bacterium JB065]